MCKFLDFLVSLFGETLPEDFNRYQILYGDAITFLKSQGLEYYSVAPDYWVGYTDEEGWRKIVPHLVQPAGDYVAEVHDCDDYAEYASALCSKKFKLNGCFKIRGDTPLGPHAWNLVLTGKNSYKLFDSNAGFPFAGELFDNGTHGYIGKTWA